MQSGGRSDFVAMEVVDGKAVFSYGGARTAITSIVVGGESLSNGRWHKVTATRNGRVMSLSVSKCTDNGDVCEECRPGDTTCYSDEVGPTGWVLKKLFLHAKKNFESYRWLMLLCAENANIFWGVSFKNLLHCNARA